MTHKKEQGVPTPHQRWVATGHCAFIDNSKTWCNLRPRHGSSHSAPYALPDGGKKWVTLESGAYLDEEWTDD